MYTLIGKQKWYWQIVITIVLIALVITGYLTARSWGYDKARREFEASDKVKAEQSTVLIAKAKALEKRNAELELKFAAFDRLDEEKRKLDGSISEKIDAVIEEGKKRNENIDAPSDCWTRAYNTCANLKQLKPPIVIDCEEYKRRICQASVVGSGCQ